MDPDMGLQSRIAETDVAAIRAEAAQQLESARELAKRVRAEAMHELEDARARVARIAAREDEMAQRWAQLLEAENALVLATKDAEAEANSKAIAPPSMPNDPPTTIAEAAAEAQQIVERANEEARRIREDAMRLLAVAEGEKAESREIAQHETEQAASEADRLRAEAAEEAKRVKAEAEQAATTSGPGSRYSRPGARKLPRIGEGASNLLSEMSDLRAKSATEEDRQVV
jgi:hypothetical protein